jgi:hypothetical protein
MIALTIRDTQKMMHALFSSASFDNFALQEASATKDTALFLEGRLNREFFSSDAQPPTSQSFASYGSVRPLLAFYMQDAAPLSFKIVLQASDDYMQKLLGSPEFTADPSCIKALILTFRYEHGVLTCLTGIAFHSFVPDKSLDHLWDSAIRKSLSHMQIAFEEM